MLPFIVFRLRASRIALVSLAIFVVPNVLYGVEYWIGGEIDTANLLMGCYSAYRFVFPLLLVFCFKDRLSIQDRRWGLNLLLWGVAFHIIFGLYQSVMLPNFALEYGPEDLPWDYQENRLVSTFLDPNLVSSLFYAAILSILCYIIYQGARLSSRYALVISGSAVVAALTASRGGAIGFIVCLIAMVAGAKTLTIQRKLLWMTVTMLALAAVIGVFVVYFGTDFIERTDRFGASNVSVDARLANLAIFVSAFSRNPAFCLGFNFFPYLTTVNFVMVSGNYADGGVLYLLASLGFVGVINLCVLVWEVAKTLAHKQTFLYPVTLLVIQSISTSSMFYPLLTVLLPLLALSMDARENTNVINQELVPRTS